MKGQRIFWYVVCMAALPLFADDHKAQDVYQAGYAAYQKQDYREAASKFEEAELEADSPVIKANSVKAQIAAWQMCKMPYKEFKAIELLLDRYPEYADFVTLVNREFELAEAYFQGEREPSYWSLRWIPWLTDGDRSSEIYEKALARAPFAGDAPRARLRLAYQLDQEGKIKPSLEQLRRLVNDYPDAAQCKYAYLSLANGLLELAKSGDGDGSCAREAVEVLNKFKERYPDATENGWVDRTLLKLRDVQAERLLVLADYYDKTGKKATAARYLAQVIQEYPESESAEPAERLLTQVDRAFTPDDFRTVSPARFPKYRSYPIPQEARKILITPEASDRKYLLPVYDLKEPAQLPPPREEESVKK